MKKQINPYLVLVFGVLAVSFSPILTKFSLHNGVDPVVIAFYRLAFTTILLIPPTFVSRENRKDFLQIKGRDLITAVFSGLFLALHFVTWFIALTKTSTFAATLLVDTHPIFVVILQFILFRECISRKGLLAIAISLMGIGLIGWGDWGIGRISSAGNLYAVLGAICVSCYFICGRVLRQRMSLFAYSFTVYGICTLVLFVWVLAARLPLYPYSLQDYLIFLSLAVVCTIFGHTVFNWALRYIHTSVISVSILGEPTGAAILAMIFFQEFPGPMVLLGGLIVLFGVFMFHAVSRHQQGKQDEDFCTSQSINGGTQG